MVRQQKEVIVYRLICVITITLAVISSTSALADSGLDSGLEVAKNTPIYVLVAKLSENAKGIGLTDDLIRNKVELRLRQNGIRISNETDWLLSAGGTYLHISVGVTDGAYSFSISLNRIVNYTVDSKSYKVFAETYNISAFGICGESLRYVIDNILNYVDIFSGDFLRVNKNYAK